MGIEPAALQEAAGGVQLRLHLHDGPLVVSFTPAEARWLTDTVAEIMGGSGA